MGREFNGKFVCSETTGFEDFMEEMGVPWLVRKGLAMFSSGNPSLECKLGANPKAAVFADGCDWFFRGCSARSDSFCFKGLQVDLNLWVARGWI